MLTRSSEQLIIHFDINNSYTLNQILSLNSEEIFEKFMPIECVLDEINIINLENKYSEMLKNGMIINSKLINREIRNENKLILVKNGHKLVSIANLEKVYHTTT